MTFWDNRDFCQDFLKKIWISHTFCPYWSQYWTAKCKQKKLGTKISIKIFVKIHYFLVEIKKNIDKSRKIANNHKSLKKSQKVSKSLKKSQKVSKSLKKSQKVSILTEKYWICIWSSILNQDILIVKTRFLKLSRFSQLSRPALCQCGEQESWSRHDGD